MGKRAGRRRKSRAPRVIAALAVIVVICVIAVYLLLPSVTVEQLILYSDQDGDGVYDLEDMVDGARLSVKNAPDYASNYYDGGYPPDTEGVCSDVIWRAFREAGYDLKALVDVDIAANTAQYPRVDGQPDPNIDFRRVANLNVFFQRQGEVLTLELKPRNEENLYQWQGGDLVITKRDDGQYHIGMLSDHRDRNGVPYVIHHPSDKPVEENCLKSWSDRGILVGHYRFPVDN